MVSAVDLSGLSGMSISSGTLTSFVLVLARTTSWAVSSPVFGVKSMSGSARLHMALALAVFLTPLVPADHVPADILGFIGVAMTQVLIGLLFGWLSGILLTAVEMAGALSDVSSGLAFGAQLDPTNGAQSSAFGRLTNMTAIALLFATDGARHILVGFRQSFAALPLGDALHLASGGPGGIGTMVSAAMLSAIQIAAPMMGVMFLVDAGLSVFSRFVPQANIMSVAFSLKTLVAIGALGTILVLLPNALDGLLTNALHAPGEVMR